MRCVTQHNQSERAKVTDWSYTKKQISLTRIMAFVIMRDTRLFNSWITLFCSIHLTRRMEFISTHTTKNSRWLNQMQHSFVISIYTGCLVTKLQSNPHYMHRGCKKSNVYTCVNTQQRSTFCLNTEIMDTRSLRPPVFGLIHWGRVTHICVGKLIIIGSDNGLSPGRRQAIIWTNAGIWLMGPLGTFIHFHSRKCTCKCRLRNVVYFVSASRC